MNQLESVIHWRQLSVAIVLALFIALFSLTQFNLLAFTFLVGAGCAVLGLSLAWNIYVMLLAGTDSKQGHHGEIADGMLITGLIFVFLGLQLASLVKGN